MFKNQHYFGQSESVMEYIHIFKEKKSLRINSKKELNKYKSMSDSIQFNNIFKTRRDSGHILGA